MGISETSPDGLDLICSALLHPILPSCVLNIFRSFLWCDCSCRHRATPSGSDFAFAGSKSSELPLTALCRLLCLYSASAGTCGWVKVSQSCPLFYTSLPFSQSFYTRANEMDSLYCWANDWSSLPSNELSMVTHHQPGNALPAQPVAFQELHPPFNSALKCIVYCMCVT